jgi:hypothetical protein
MFDWIQRKKTKQEWFQGIAFVVVMVLVIWGLWHNR